MRRRILKTKWKNWEYEILEPPNLAFYYSEGGALYNKWCVPLKSSGVFSKCLVSTKQADGNTTYSRDYDLCSTLFSLHARSYNNNNPLAGEELVFDVVFEDGRQTTFSTTAPNRQTSFIPFDDAYIQFGGIDYKYVPPTYANKCEEYCNLWLEVKEGFPAITSVTCNKSNFAAYDYYYGSHTATINGHTINCSYGHCNRVKVVTRGGVIKSFIHKVLNFFKKKGGAL